MLRVRRFRATQFFCFFLFGSTSGRRRSICVRSSFFSFLFVFFFRCWTQAKHLLQTKAAPLTTHQLMGSLVSSSSSSSSFLLLLVLVLQERKKITLVYSLVSFRLQLEFGRRWWLPLSDCLLPVAPHHIICLTMFYKVNKGAVLQWM